MCEHCGHGGQCAVCGWDQDAVPLVGWTDETEDNRRVCTECGAYSFERCTADCSQGGAVAVCVRDSVTQEQLRELDSSLSLDAGELAADAVRRFAESLVMDVGYAERQLGGVDVRSGVQTADRVRRALDAVERVAAAVRGACRPL